MIRVRGDRGGSSGPGRHAGRRGFSLMELLVVLSLLAIICSLIVPQFSSGYEDLVLRASARKLAAVMGLAYSQAVSTGSPHRLRIDPARNLYWIEEEVQGPSGEESYRPLRDVPDAAGKIDPRIALRPMMLEDPDPGRSRPRGIGEADREEEAASFAFRPDGTADPGEVALRDREGFGLLLRIHPLTARIRISDLEREVPR